MQQASLTHAEEIAKGLYPHQIEGIAFLLGRRRALLADDMGLGKTRQSIIAMVEAEGAGPYLVICPASIKRNWAREIEIVFPDAEPAIVGPAPLPPPDHCGWIIVNYEILGKNLDKLLEFDWKGVVFDEAHYLKNYQSQRSQNASKLVKEIKRDLVVHALTGTPMTSRPRDLFPLLQILGHSLGKSFLSFAKRYCDAYQGDFGLVADGASNIEELTVQLHGVMLRRTKDEVLDLPPKMRTWMDIELHPYAIQHFNRLAQEFISKFDTPEAIDGIPESVGLSSEHHNELDDSIDTTDLGTGIGRLTQVRRAIAFVKCRHTIKFVENALEQGEKVIIFTSFLNTMQRFQRHFKDRAVYVSGEVPVHERQNRVDRFQNDDDTKLFIANMHIAGVGINLTAARQIVFNDLDWVPANHWQAEDRAYRIGQTGTVNVTYMIATGTVDSFVKTVLETKAALMDSIVEGSILIPDGAAALQLDVLSELKRMMNALSVQTSELKASELHDVLQKAGETYLEENASHLRKATRAQLRPYSEEAIRTLAQVLAGPERSVYHAESSSQAGKFYTLEVVGVDVTCDCPGFTHRGSCRHVRPLKSALVAGKPLPKGYKQISSN
ncbi:MAG: DEAD/DEAH box helicase [Candidatus Poribacteria bacterium]|nr:DEAD/DEAH box helicase [Candidatus Poribacteria bacterium]